MSADSFDKELSGLYQQRKDQIKAPELVGDTTKKMHVKRSPWHTLALLLTGGAASFGIMAIVTHFAAPPAHNSAKHYQPHSVRIIELGEVKPQAEALLPVTPRLPPQPESLPPKTLGNSLVKQEQIVLLKAELPAQKVFNPLVKIPKINAKLVAINPIHKVMPEYPKSALHEQKSGTVKLQYIISDEGKAVDITNLNKQVDRVLVRSAKKALTQWRYAKENSSSQILEVEFEFNLEK